MKQLILILGALISCPQISIVEVEVSVIHVKEVVVEVEVEEAEDTILHHVVLLKVFLILLQRLVLTLQICSVSSPHSRRLQFIKQK